MWRSPERGLRYGFIYTSSLIAYSESGSYCKRVSKSVKFGTPTWMKKRLTRLSEYKEKRGLGDTRKLDDGLRKTIPAHHYRGSRMGKCNYLVQQPGFKMFFKMVAFFHCHIDRHLVPCFDAQSFPVFCIPAQVETPIDMV